ncbi:MAG: hypothetical protein K2W95_29050 [Candidatus Obscuribacterales bacterium]|nr:hypothetical protein [Candidatus Obscuribacterales bacterium]
MDEGKNPGSRQWQIPPASEFVSGTPYAVDELTRQTAARLAEPVWGKPTSLIEQVADQNKRADEPFRGLHSILPESGVINIMGNINPNVLFRPALAQQGRTSVREIGKALMSPREILVAQKSGLENVFTMAQTQQPPATEGAWTSTIPPMSEDMKQREYVCNTHYGDVAAMAAGSALSLISLYGKVPELARHGLSQPAIAQLETSIAEMRLSLLQRVTIPAEQGLIRLGWGVRASGWALPPNRWILKDRGEIFGQQGLRPSSDLWRDKEGRVFGPCGRNGDGSSMRTWCLSSAELKLASRNGALTQREFALVSELGRAEVELSKLNKLDDALKGTSGPHPSDFAPNNSCVFKSRTGADMWVRHNSALERARGELTAAELAERHALKQPMTGLRVLFGAHATSKIVDDYCFEKTPVSFRTAVVDFGSSSVVLTRLHWAGKAAAIIGSHVASRMIDYRMREK